MRTRYPRPRNPQALNYMVTHAKLRLVYVVYNTIVSGTLSYGADACPVHNVTVMVIYTDHDRFGYTTLQEEIGILIFIGHQLQRRQKKILIRAELICTSVHVELWCLL